MYHSVPGGRSAVCIIDISVDQFVGSRATSVNNVVPKVMVSWQEKVVKYMSNDFSFTGCRYLDLDSTDGTGGFSPPVVGHPVNSGGSTAQAPPNVCMLVHKQCGHNRAQRNGRMFLPGAAENEVANDGTLTTVARTAWTGNVEAFRADVASGVFFPPATTSWRVVHVAGHTGSPLPGYPNGKPNAWSSSDISSVSVDTKVATQRRRLRK